MRKRRKRGKEREKVTCPKIRIEKGVVAVTKYLQRRIEKLWAFRHVKYQQSEVQQGPEAVMAKSEADSRAADMASLETLPQKLKLSVLSQIPDISTLNNLILASPTCYQAIISTNAGTKILSTILHREICPEILVEARFLLKARRIKRNENWLSVVQELIREYKNEKKTLVKAENGQGEGSEVLIEEENVLEVVKPHCLILEMAKEFCIEALGKHPVTEEFVDSPVILSDAEERRVQRALYRFEIFRVLFAEKDNWNSSSYRPREFDGMETSHLYLSSMRVWEVEELACIRDWMFRVYGRMLEEVRGLVYEVDLEVERDELRCFLKDEGEIEERARMQVQVRGMCSRLPPLILIHSGGIWKG